MFVLRLWVHIRRDEPTVAKSRPELETKRSQLVDCAKVACATPSERFLVSRVS